MIIPLGLAIAGLAGIVTASLGLAEGGSNAYRAYAPILSSEPTQTPTPTPTATPSPTPRPAPYVGATQSIYLASAGLYNYSTFEVKGTHWVGDREVLDDPSGPSPIAWYPNLQGGALPPAPGFPGGHTLLAAHVNYVGYGNGPFAHLTSATVGDALYLTMDNGTQYAYTVKSVDIVSLDNLDMNPIVYPPLDEHTERVTLISCGGTFIPNPSGYGGSYDSRVILVAERYVE
jgi:hypothetical protein